MNSRSYEPLRKLSQGKFTLSDFVKLKALAKNTVGCTSDFLLHQMSVLLEPYAQLDSKVNELEQQIEDCICGIAPPMLSIPGIGALSAAVILSEYSDFSKFKNPSNILFFTGLEPGYSQSSQSKFNGRMVKHGSSSLRYAL